MALTTTIKVFLTDEEKNKINLILKHFNSDEEVISGEVKKWSKKEVYELLLGLAIKNFDWNNAN